MTDKQSSVGESPDETTQVSDAGAPHDSGTSVGSHLNPDAEDTVVQSDTVRAAAGRPPERAAEGGHDPSQPSDQSDDTAESLEPEPVAVPPAGPPLVASTPPPLAAPPLRRTRPLTPPTPPPTPPPPMPPPATERIPMPGASQPPDQPDDEQQGTPGRGRQVAIIAGAVVLVLGLAYGITYLVAGDKLARNATVAGIEVGGLTPDEARAQLAADLPAIVDVPIRLRLGDTDATYDVLPSEAGLGIDLDATVSAVPGGSANPISLVRALLGGEEVDPRPVVDTDAMRSSLDAIAEQTDREPVNAAVAFEEGDVVTSEPVTGRALEVEGAMEVLTAAFFGEEYAELPIGEVRVPVAEVEPSVTAAELERAVSEFAEPAMSGPVTLSAGGSSVDLSPQLIGQALAMKPDDTGTLQPELNGPKLAELASDELAQIGQQGKDATIRIENGAPVVIPAQAGLGIDKDSLGEVVLAALTEEGADRRAEVELVEVEPELTTEGAQALGVKEVVSEFTTNFPPAEYRDVNIGRAASLINNTFLRPGDEFSLNGIVGERTEANGFTSGTIINQGRLEDSLGGGVSQVATTTFHAAFKAGLEDVEHWPHSIYFDRYPVGQEATVAWGSKDLRFVNDTPYGVLIETVFTASAGRSQGSLTVRLWSTEHFRVETSVSERTDFTSPRTIYDTSDECTAQSGSQGFSITSYRKVWEPDGTLVKDEAKPWTYNPNHTVVCGPDPNDKDDD